MLCYLRLLYSKLFHAEAAYFAQLNLLSNMQLNITDLRYGQTLVITNEFKVNMINNKLGLNVPSSN